MGDKRCGESMAERVEMQANRTTSVLHNVVVTTNRRTSISESASDVYESSAAASAPSSFSAGLSDVISISKLAHRA